MGAVSDGRWVGAEPESYIEDVLTEGGKIPGIYWDGKSDPNALSLSAGGTVLYNLRDTAEGVVFDVLLASGPRDAKADPFARDDQPYFGPGSIYTCFSITAEFRNDQFVDWGRDDIASQPGGAKCDSRLVETLGAGASAELVNEFDG